MDLPGSDSSCTGGSLFEPDSEEFKVTDVVVLGTGMIADLVYHYLSSDEDWRVCAFTVDKDHMEGGFKFGLPVVPFESIKKHYHPDNFAMIVAVGYSKLNTVRERKFNQAKEMGYHLPGYIHPSNSISENVNFGSNCLVFEQNVILPYTCVEDNVIIWTNNTIGNHCHIESHCWISMNATVSGETILDKNTFVGASATIGPSIHVGKSCIVGAGAVVLRDAEAGGVYKAIEAPRSKVPSSRVRSI